MTWSRPDLVGEKHHLAVLTARDVNEIRRRRKQDPKRWTYMALSIEYDVGHGTISAILAGRTWRHLLPEEER